MKTIMFLLLTSYILLSCGSDNGPKGGSNTPNDNITNELTSQNIENFLENQTFKIDKITYNGFDAEIDSCASVSKFSFYPNGELEIDNSKHTCPGEETPAYKELGTWSVREDTRKTYLILMTGNNAQNIEELEIESINPKNGTFNIKIEGRSEDGKDKTTIIMVFAKQS